MDRKTAAEVTGSIDFASNDGKTVTFSFGVCFQRKGSAAVIGVGGVHPKFQTAAFNWWAQSVTGVVAGLPSGDYRLGLCSEAESSNTLHAQGRGTVILAETS
jgi:hypothetical protein